MILSLKHGLNCSSEQKWYCFGCLQRWSAVWFVTVFNHCSKASKVHYW